MLTALFVLAWRRAWGFGLPTFDASESPHYQLGQTIRVAEVLAVTASLSAVLAGPATLFRVLRGPFGAFAACALALAGLAAASACWALRPGLALIQGAHLLIWVAFAVVVAEARVPPDRMVAAFVLGLLVHATVGFAQVIIQNHVGLTVLGELRIPPDDPLKKVQAGASWFLRAYGLSPHPNVLAGHLAMGLILSWGLSAGQRHVSRRLVGATWVALLACLLLTFSRSGLLAAVVGMIGAGIWLSHAGVLARPIAGLGRKVAVTAMVVIAVFAVAFSPYLTKRVMDALMGVDIRLVLLNVAIKLIAEHPVSGVGAGNFSVATWAATSGQTTYDAVHNVLLLVVAELGLTGLVVVGTMVTVLVAVGYRRWHARSNYLWYGLLAGSLMGLVTVSLFDHYLWTHPQGGLLAAWLVGWWLTDEPEHTSAGDDRALSSVPDLR